MHAGSPTDAGQVGLDANHLRRERSDRDSRRHVRIRRKYVFGSQVVLAHLISPADFGLIAMTAPIVGFVQLFNELGLLEATIQRPHLTQRELSTLFWISLSVSTALALLLAAAGPLIARLYAEPRAAQVTACLACTIIMSGLASQPMALLNRRMEFIRLAVIDLASTAAMACVGIGAAAMGFGYWSLVLTSPRMRSLCRVGFGVATIVCLVRAWLDAAEVSGIGSVVILGAVMAITHLAVMAGLASAAKCCVESGPCGIFSDGKRFRSVRRQRAGSAVPPALLLVYFSRARRHCGVKLAQLWRRQETSREIGTESSPEQNET